MTPTTQRHPLWAAVMACIATTCVTSAYAQDEDNKPKATRAYRQSVTGDSDSPPSGNSPSNTANDSGSTSPSPARKAPKPPPPPPPAPSKKPTPAPAKDKPPRAEEDADPSSDPRSSSLLKARRDAAKQGKPTNPPPATDSRTPPPSEEPVRRPAPIPPPLPPSPPPVPINPVAPNGSPPNGPPEDITPAPAPRRRPSAPVPPPPEPPAAPKNRVFGGGGPLTQAGDIYAGIGLPGLMFGYAQPMMDRFNLRGDFATMPFKYSNSYTNGGVPYKGDWAMNRFGLFLDFFPFDLGLRAVGGLTFTDYHVNLLTYSSQNFAINFNGQTWTIPANGGLEMAIKYPTVMPYFGLGWGHNPMTDGWSMAFDAGIMYGKPSVTAKPVGAYATAYNIEFLSAYAEFFRKNYADKYPFIPQLSIAVTYRF